ncbi:MAG: SUMF1/EgtB/PvdO family nonheme iron enzyme [Phycisphaerales bacterium]|jgi:formylglycine-generating enzyme required for sulfatase activity|nr:SUMF1/EgtB/PvdO family nonheme iron enzyme [Phycisphaerales bacterium]
MNNGEEPYSPLEELPQHEVEVAAFEIGKYEVTRAQYRRFMEDEGYDNPVDVRRMGLGAASRTLLLLRRAAVELSFEFLGNDRRLFC